MKTSLPSFMPSGAGQIPPAGVEQGGLICLKQPDRKVMSMQ